MDANGQRFWMLSEPSDWELDDAEGVSANLERRCLCLCSQRRGDALRERLDLSEAALQVVPQARDRFGTRASLQGLALQATGAGPGQETIATFATGSRVTDLLVGHDDLLYVAVDEQVHLQSLVEHWDPVRVELPGFAAWRLAPDPGGGVWVLDRSAKALARLEGVPLPRQACGPAAPGVFRPEPEEAHPPILRRVDAAVFTDGEDPVALASSPGGSLAVLCWVAGGAASLRLLGEDGVLSPALTLDELQRPYSLAWLDDQHLAVLIAQERGFREAPVFALPADPESPRTLQVHGEIYPVRGDEPTPGGGDPPPPLALQPFVHSPTTPPHYVDPDGGHRPLVPLSLTTRARAGEVCSAGPIDGERSDLCWHRVYLEGVFPPGSGVRLWLATTPDPAPPGPGVRWHQHLFGAAEATGELARPPARGVWFPFPSEVPHHPGLLDRPIEAHRAGVFSVLVQREELRVTALRGRFLWVRVELLGDGRTSPEIRALRFYGSRFSYVEEYLPALYQESVFGPEADEPAARTTPSDFLERFLANMEGVLSPLEDRIAQAQVLCDPDGTPEKSLDWLGSWIGLILDPAWPAERRRDALRRAADLQRWHGTLPGLNLALDLLTGGGIARGEILAVENFRLRRTLATILGADLVRRDDELLPGLHVIGNSVVGDTLFLGEDSAARREELLALYHGDLPASETEREGVKEFYERFAYRLTVLVRHAADDALLGLVRRVVELEVPAHLEARVVRAGDPLIIGLSSLVEVDTFLVERPGFQTVRLGESRLGFDDLLRRPPSLDPRLEGGAP